VSPRSSTELVDSDIAGHRIVRVFASSSPFGAFMTPPNFILICGRGSHASLLG
jgi:hypothetical protein